INLIKMKPLKSINEADLLQHPIWQYYAESSDETALVVETDRASLSEDDKRVFIARTTFIFNDGSVRFGYSSPQDFSGLDYIQPVIVLPVGQISLWNQTLPPISFWTEKCKQIGKTVDEVFPLKIRVDVPVDGVFNELVIQLSSICYAQTNVT